MLEDVGHVVSEALSACARAGPAAAGHQGRCRGDRPRDARHDRQRTGAADQAALAGAADHPGDGLCRIAERRGSRACRDCRSPICRTSWRRRSPRWWAAMPTNVIPLDSRGAPERRRSLDRANGLAKTRRIGQTAGHNGNVPRSPRQRRGVRPVARRLLCGRHDRRVDLVRHAGHRQHRASRLHHSGLLHRLHRQHDVRHRSDPGGGDRAAGVLSARRGGLSGVLPRLRAARRRSAARPRVLLRPAVHHRGHARAGVRRGLSAGRGAVYRAKPASGHRRSAAAAAGALPGRTGDDRRAAAVHVAHVPGPRDPCRGAGPAGTAPDGGEPDPHQTHRVRRCRSPPRRWPARC